MVSPSPNDQQQPRDDEDAQEQHEYPAPQIIGDPERPLVIPFTLESGPLPSDDLFPGIFPGHGTSEE